MELDRMSDSFGKQGGELAAALDNGDRVSLWRLETGDGLPSLNRDSGFGRVRKASFQIDGEDAWTFTATDADGMLLDRFSLTDKARVLEHGAERIRMLRKNELVEYRDGLIRWNRTVPEAPFKKSWPEIALRRMLRQAVDEGAEYLVWSNGPEVALANRADKGSRAYDGIQRFYQKTLPKLLSRILRSPSIGVEPQIETVPMAIGTENEDAPPAPTRPWRTRHTIRSASRRTLTTLRGTSWRNATGRPVTGYGSPSQTSPIAK